MDRRRRNLDVRTMTGTELRRLAATTDCPIAWLTARAELRERGL